MLSGRTAQLPSSTAHRPPLPCKCLRGSKASTTDMSTSHPGIIRVALDHLSRTPLSGRFDSTIDSACVPGSAISAVATLLLRRNFAHSLPLKVDDSSSTTHGSVAHKHHTPWHQYLRVRRARPRRCLRHRLRLARLPPPLHRCTRPRQRRPPLSLSRGRARQSQQQARTLSSPTSPHRQNR